MALVAPAVAAGFTCISPGESLKQGQDEAKLGIKARKITVCLSDALGEAEVIINCGATWKCAALRHSRHPTCQISLSYPQHPTWDDQQEQLVARMAAQLCWSPLADGM